jgi:hypothetical protein
VHSYSLSIDASLICFGSLPQIQVQRQRDFLFDEIPDFSAVVAFLDDDDETPLHVQQLQHAFSQVLAYRTRQDAKLRDLARTWHAANARVGGS